MTVTRPLAITSDPPTRPAELVAGDRTPAAGASPVLPKATALYTISCPRPQSPVTPPRCGLNATVSELFAAESSVQALKGSAKAPAAGFRRPATQHASVRLSELQTSFRNDAEGNAEVSKADGAEDEGSKQLVQQDSAAALDTHRLHPGERAVAICSSQFRPGGLPVAQNPRHTLHVRPSGQRDQFTVGQDESLPHRTIKAFGDNGEYSDKIRSRVINPLSFVGMHIRQFSPPRGSRGMRKAIDQFYDCDAEPGPEESSRVSSPAVSSPVNAHTRLSPCFGWSSRKRTRPDCSEPLEEPAPQPKRPSVSVAQVHLRTPHGSKSTSTQAHPSKSITAWRNAVWEGAEEEEEEEEEEQDTDDDNEDKGKRSQAVPPRSVIKCGGSTAQPAQGQPAPAKPPTHRFGGRNTGSRQKWTEGEDECLRRALEVEFEAHLAGGGLPWQTRNSRIWEKHGENGTVDQVLWRRTATQMKDRENTVVDQYTRQGKRAPAMYYPGWDIHDPEHFERTGERVPRFQ